MEILWRSRSWPPSVIENLEVKIRFVGRDQHGFSRVCIKDVEGVCTS